MMTDAIAGALERAPGESATPHHAMWDQREDGYHLTIADETAAHTHWITSDTYHELGDKR